MVGVIDPYQGWVNKFLHCASNYMNYTRFMLQNIATPEEGKLQALWNKKNSNCSYVPKESIRKESYCQQ